jgi:pyrroloquinoline quinone biosynthesis protein E
MSPDTAFEPSAVTGTAIDPPVGLLAELTHRCPLQCPYCSNPLELQARGAELSTETWRRILDEAAALGVLQVHFSGGEPLARDDLAELVGHADRLGLYGNLITSAVMLDEKRLGLLAEQGLGHVQISFQDALPAEADRLAGYAGGFEKKVKAAQLVRAAGLSLTLNLVVHRQNLDRLDQMIALGETLGANRIEIAHVQYYAWALANQTALMPSLAQLDAADATVAAAREAYKGRMVIDYVTSDYHARFPKACMAGWARRFITVTPAGRVLPCHAAETIPGIALPSVTEASLAEIWQSAPLFQAFRGTSWMQEPCRSCERREIDWGGCRCQALALTGDAAATDPICERSPEHGLVADAIALAQAAPPALIYRRHGNAPAQPH